MSIKLHHEYTATVTGRMPWGTVAILGDQTEVLIDNTKVGAVLPDVGTEVHVVILDDDRTPARASLLGEDKMIARGLRGADGDGCSQT